MARPVSKPYMSDLDDLKKWFLDQNIPYFKVYAGHGKPVSVGTDNLVEDDTDIAVEALIGYLNMNYVPGGQFTINVFPDPNKYNAGIKKQLFQFKMSDTTASINGPGQSPGINRSEMQLMLDNQQLRWENDQLEAQLDNAGTEDIKGVAMSLLKEHAPQIIGIFGALLGPKPASAIYGPPQTTPIDNVEIDNTDPVTEEDQIESFENSMSVLKHHFGNDIVPVFAKLAAFVDADPEKAKNLLNTFL